LNGAVVVEVLVVRDLAFGRYLSPNGIVIGLRCVSLFARDLATQFQLARIRKLFRDCETAITGVVALHDAERSWIASPSDRSHGIRQRLHLGYASLHCFHSVERALGLRILLQSLPDDIIEQQHRGRGPLIGLHTATCILRSCLVVL